MVLRYPRRQPPACTTVAPAGNKLNHTPIRLPAICLCQHADGQADGWDYLYLQQKAFTAEPFCSQLHLKLPLWDKGEFVTSPNHKDN